MTRLVPIGRTSRDSSEIPKQIIYEQVPRDGEATRLSPRRSWITWTKSAQDRRNACEAGRNSPGCLIPASRLCYPLCQFLKVRQIHAKHQLCSVHIMDGEKVIFMENDLVTLFQTVQPRFDQRIVDHASEVTARSIRNSHPEVFAPATRRNILFRERQERRWMFMSQNRLRHLPVT